MLQRVHSLRFRFVLAIGALVAVVLTANAAVLVVTSQHRLRRDIERRARAYAALSMRPVVQAYSTYYTSGYGKFRDLVTGLMSLDPDVASVAVYDTEGLRLFESGEFADPMFDPSQRVPALTGDPRLQRAVKEMAITEWHDTGADGRPIHVVVTPAVEEWGRHRYSVVFTSSYQSLDTAARKAAWQIAALAAASLTVGVLIAVVLAAQSLRPVDALTRSARALAGGSLDQRIRLTTGDEFEVLAGAFNQMAEQLATTIADLEATNRALQRMNLELRNLDRLKSDLLANVSHELRTPLTAIRGYAEAMDDGLLGAVDASQRQALGVVKRNIDRLMGMIGQLLNFARAEAGAAELSPAAFDLRSLAEQVIDGLQVAQGRTIHFDPGSGIPPVYGDSARIAQVLENLLANALKFTPAAGRVELTLRRLDAEVELRVADTGIGIAEQEVGKIFDRFYQVDSSTTRKYGGMGLGLALVREILQAHERTITVRSTPGLGTTFCFTLPEAQLPAAVTGARRGPRVVLVDDDIGFGQTIESLLTRHGYAVETALTGERGFKTIEACVPDLILLDRLLPDCDGFDLLSRLKRHPRTCDVPVIIVSVRQQRALGLRLGADGYLVKPVDGAALLQALAQALNPAAAGSPILVADEEAGVRELLRQRLVENGFRVAEAAGGREALALLAEERPALLILGLAMPDLDGWQLLRQVRADPRTRELPVIVISGHDQATDRAMGTALGVADFVSKPFDAGSLIDAIERTLATAGRAGGSA